MLYAAFTIGLFGSLHCLGMCGPIAFAIPVHTSEVRIKFLKHLVYNLGRVVTYTILGIAIGLVGKGFVVAGLQQIISIVTGIILVTSVIIIHHPLKNFFLNKVTLVMKENLKSAFRYYFKKTGWSSLFILGSLNGLLPCGMVYLGMLGALATGHAFSGAAFMAFFGLGTVPMMMSVPLLGSVASEKWKLLYRKASPVLICSLGVLLILRGLNLNIPYVSPGDNCCQIHSCH